MSKVAALLRRIQERNKAQTKAAEKFHGPEKVDLGRFSVRADTLWWLLKRREIQQHEYFTGRELQGLYLSAQIQPPRCFLGRPTNGTHTARIEKMYPSEFEFSCLRRLAQIKRRMRRSSWIVLERTICRYCPDDDVMVADKAMKMGSIEIIADALSDAAYAAGYTTETLYAKERKREFRRDREALQGKPA